MDQDTTPHIQELIQKSAEGDEQAFRELVSLLSDRLFFYTLSRIPKRSEAKDMVQEICIDLWQALKRFNYRSDAEFYGFVFLIARRKIAKEKKKSLDISLEEHDITESYEMDIEDYSYLVRWIEQLKKSRQELIRLRYWGGLSFKEIATILKITENTAKVWHHRSIQKLKQHARTT